MKDMKLYIDFTDDDLRMALRRMDERDTPQLPPDFADRVMSRINQSTTVSPEREKEGERYHLPSGRTRGGFKKLVWLVAASVAAIVVLTVALWHKPTTTIYEDTFTSVEEASLVLCNNMDDNTIAL
jgi:hypothetical protein